MNSSCSLDPDGGLRALLVNGKNELALVGSAAKKHFRLGVAFLQVEGQDNYCHLFFGLAANPHVDAMSIA